MQETIDATIVAMLEAAVGEKVRAFRAALERRLAALAKEAVRKAFAQAGLADTSPPPAAAAGGNGPAAGQ